MVLNKNYYTRNVDNVNVTNHLQYLVTQKESYLQYHGSIIQRYVESHTLTNFCGQQKIQNNILEIKSAV